MVNSARLIMLLLLLACLPVAAQSSEYTLFSPRPLEGELLLPERGKGVLVKRITIQPGDTLSKISQKFSGRSSFFPQILLFNDIRNPDLIRAGRDLLVPITRKDALAANAPAEKKAATPERREPLPKAVQKAAKAAKPAPLVEKKPRSSAAKVTEKKKRLSSEQAGSRGEQQYYSMALTAYRQEEYKKALNLFSRFLELYPSSALAPDASLYKAESLFKLSAQ